MARKLWSGGFPAIVGDRKRFESKAAAYRWVRHQVTNLHMLRSPVVNVYVDERDGQGWQLYEQIDLREWPQWEDKADR